MTDNKQPQFSTKPPGKPQEEKRVYPPVLAVRVMRMGNNSYRVVEETYSGPPTTVRTLQDNVDRVTAELEVRLWNENVNLGPQRFGQSGLEQ